MPNIKKRKPKKTRGSNERRTWIEKVDRVFSLYIRLRDSKPWRFRAFRCISCGDVKPFEQMDCGHFIGRGCMPLRFNTMNGNGECRACNRMDSSHLLFYRKNLIQKLGEDAISGSALAMSLEPKKRQALITKLGTQKVEALEAQKYDMKKWSVEELKELYMYYAALVLELKDSI